MIKTLNLTLLLLINLFLATAVADAKALNQKYCFPEGCFFNQGKSTAFGGESYTDYYNKIMARALSEAAAEGKTIAKNFTGSIDLMGGYITLVFKDGVFLQRNCSNGRVTQFTPIISTCTNGATNHPTCTTCPAGKSMVSGQCSCNNGATGDQCNICPSGLAMENNICVCQNGANNPTACNQCPLGSNMVSGQCVCSNGATPQSNCSQCPSGKVMSAGSCVDGCSLTNVCGKTSQGVIINGVCSAADGSNINNSCITTFTVPNTSVNPNGSVEFTWKIADLVPNVKQTCGFYDYTTPTPRPIPGLQNLDTAQDKARISNIQTTTRFCLVCQFYNSTTNASLGDAIAHQWIRVIRVGEN